MRICHNDEGISWTPSAKMQTGLQKGLRSRPKKPSWLLSGCFPSLPPPPPAPLSLSLSGISILLFLQSHNCKWWPLYNPEFTFWKARLEKAHVPQFQLFSSKSYCLMGSLVCYWQWPGGQGWHMAAGAHLCGSKRQLRGHLWVEKMPKKVALRKTVAALDKWQSLKNLPRLHYCFCI